MKTMVMMITSIMVKMMKADSDYDDAHDEYDDDDDEMIMMMVALAMMMMMLGAASFTDRHFSRACSSMEKS